MKHWMVTGAGRGIGLELTRQLLEAGEQVTALVREPAKAKELAQLGSENFKILKADVTSESDLAQAARSIEGPLDILINNAGVYLKDESPLSELDLKIVERTFEVNVLGPMRVTKAFLPALRKSMHPIVANITSLMGSIADNGSGGSYGYRISKAALNMFGKNLALEFPKAVVLQLHPGWVKTDMGGAGAPTEKHESAAGLLKVITGASPKDTGAFFDFRGKRLEW